MPSANREIKFGTPLHKRVMSALTARYDLSERKMSTRHKAWKKSEEQFLAYLPETELDKGRRQKHEQDGEPQYTTLVMPYTYAMLMTAHTYYSSVFLARNPVLQITARHGEPANKVLALEALLDYQRQVAHMLVPWYIWLYDVLKYGIGITGIFWDEEEITVSNIIEQPKLILGLLASGKTEKIRKTETIPGYVGNRVYNVRPYDFFPDTRLPMVDYQQGEFVIVRSDVGWHKIRQGDFFNLDRVQRTRSEGSTDRVEGTAQYEYPETENLLSSDLSMDLKDVGTGDLKEATVDLAPNDWGLGSRKTLEKWIFTYWENEVIIGARPSGAYHNKFPFAVHEYEIEGYAVSKRSMPEVLQDLQRTMDWLVNSHLHNVRKTINDQFIVDPTMVNMSDLTDPEPGKLIRLLPRAYGTPGAMDAAIKQLQVTDITQNNLRDVQVIIDMMQRAVGVSDNIMGMLASGGRRTATEVRTSSSFGVNRLKTQAEWGSAQGWEWMTQIMIQNTQQYYELAREFKIVGDLSNGPQGQQQTVKVGPEDIVGFFDFVPVDGTMPVDRFAQANLWRELLGGLAKMPGLLEQYDVAGMFSWVAKLAGMKNIDQFRIQVTPDQILQQQLQAGNVVPLGGSDGRGGGDGNQERDLGRVSEPGQISGVGPTA